MISVLFNKIKEALISVLPVAALVLLLDLTPLVQLTWTETLVFLSSALLLILGIGLFNLGADLAMTPMGEHIGAGLSKTKKLSLLLGVCFAMGVFITVAEPDLTVLADQVASFINPISLIVFVGVGVGMFLLLSVLKIIFKKPLSSLLIFFYMLMFALAALVAVNGRGTLLSLAFDSGGVTTGPITVPFIMALGVGVAATLGGKNVGENSFGLIAMCSVGPILAVLALGITAKQPDAYTMELYDIESTLSFGALGEKLFSVMEEVALALGLIVIFFAILQIVCLRLPLKKLCQIGIGIVYTFLGLVIFLTSVSIGFMPIGQKMGMALAEYTQDAGTPTILILFSFVLGMVVVLAEPAVHVLNKQVEDITDGMVSKRSMMWALSIGVGISIALSVLRIYFGFNVLYYLIPGYFVSLGLSFFVPGLYSAIAFDSGGVASGPLTSTFILPFVIGVCYQLQGESEVMNLAFGMVAMVAMTPLITIQLLGFKAILTKKVRENIAMKRILSADDEQIINFM